MVQAMIRSTSQHAKRKVRSKCLFLIAHVSVNSVTLLSFPTGITVSNTPGAVDDATATTALYLMISALRQYAKAERDVRAGLWKSQLKSGNAHDATGRTLAILGLGGIGFRLAELAHAFPMRIIYHNRRKVEGAPDWCEYFPSDKLDEFLAQADVLSVHVPLRKETEGFVSEAMIRKLKKGAIIVNTARGKVIDEDAMIRALADGHVRMVIPFRISCDQPLSCSWVLLVSMYTLTSQTSTLDFSTSLTQPFSHTWVPKHATRRRRWRSVLWRTC